VKGIKKFGEGSTVMLEADLDASPRTLRFFAYDGEQRLFVTHIPQSINFAVCPPLMLHLLFSFLQVSSRCEDISFTLSLREVAECAGRGLPNSLPKQWGTEW
jgi:hypothetical protein